jgi:hypothetical protein
MPSEANWDLVWRSYAVVVSPGAVDATARFIALDYVEAS